MNVDEPIVSSTGMDIDPPISYFPVNGPTPLFRLPFTPLLRSQSSHSSPPTTGRCLPETVLPNVNQKFATTVTTVKDKTRYRVNGGLPLEQLEIVKGLLSKLHSNASIEASVTSEVATRTLILCLEGLPNCPKPSLSAEGTRSNLRNFCWNSANVGRPLANGALPVVSIEAVNIVFNMPIPGIAPNRQRTQRMIGDSPSLDYDSGRMERATINHASEKMAKVYIINTVSKWIEILIGKFLLVNVVDARLQSLFVSVMVSKTIRRAIGLAIFESFANRNEVVAIGSH